MNQQNKSYKVLGIMSGTSLDGIDLCLAEFKQINSIWKYKLRNIENEAAVELAQLDFEYGKLLGSHAKEFLAEHNQTANLIASHGHTIFHQIEKGFTYQLGHGAAIAAASDTLCINDFRSLDVALGGQGAPLVPFGDEHLFSSFEACVNLGGIANFSLNQNGTRIAYDICVCNMVLNYFTNKYFSIPYDKNGQISRTGNLIPALYDKLNALGFFNTKPPKSLGKEWVDETIIPLMEKESAPLADKLFTFTSHVAFQIARNLKSNGVSKNILFTGGGSKNIFLMKLLRKQGLEFSLPDEKTIDFKEALIFAFLGLNRHLGIPNTLKSVTGATKDSCGGCIYYP